MIGIIEYGMGNLRSVRNALVFLGVQPVIVSNRAEIDSCDALILPGVGAFGDGMDVLRERGLVDVLAEEVLGKKKPFLGLCLGMQLLASKGFEFGEHDGLGWIPGAVTRMETAIGGERYRIPHIGWNDVRLRPGSGFYKGFAASASFYFVHSYVLVPDDRAVVSGTFEYGREYVASIEHGNIWATQFHPEKSHRNGLGILKNWIERWSLC